MLQIGTVEIVFLAIGIGVPVAAIGTLLWRGRNHAPESFAAAHGIELTGESRNVIEGYLRRSFRWRMGGAAVGLALPLGTGVPGVEMILGYLIGALAAELSESRLSREGESVASLTPRALTDYVSRRILRTLRAVAITGAVVASLYVVVPLRESDVTGMSFVLVAAVIVAIGISVEIVLRLIVRKPQPASSSDLVAADDAIRAASIHAAVGAGIAVILLLMGTELFMLGGITDVQLLRWTFPMLAGLSVLAAFLTWARFGHDVRWRVLRSAPTREAPA